MWQLIRVWCTRLRTRLAARPSARGPGSAACRCPSASSACSATRRQLEATCVALTDERDWLHAELGRVKGERDRYEAQRDALERAALNPLGRPVQLFQSN